MKRVQPDSTSSRADRDAQSASGQRILFTGPDGIGDFRPRLDYFPRSIGIGPLCPDATSDLSYLFRSAPNATPPLPKHGYTGAVGWGLQYSPALNRPDIPHKQHESVMQDGVTHGPRHTQPRFGDKQPSAWRNRSALDPYSEDDNKHSRLYKQTVSVSTEKAHGSDMRPKASDS